MILDTSAIVAILYGEDEGIRFAELIESVDEVLVSAATVLEASIVLGPRRQHLLADFLSIACARIVPVNEDQLAIARRGHLRYGRGSGSKARLNFGDCFTYALAKATGQAVLFKGDDFTHTDLTELPG
jgi:ribonuclease VapC